MFRSWFEAMDINLNLNKATNGLRLYSKHKPKFATIKIKYILV